MTVGRGAGISSARTRVVTSPVAAARTIPGVARRDAPTTVRVSAAATASRLLVARVLVGPSLRGEGNSRRDAAQQWVRRGGEARDRVVQVMAICQMRALVGEHGAAFVGVEAT